MREHALLIALWEKPDHRSAGFQAQYLAGAAAVPEDYRRVMACVDISQAARRRLVLGVKQSRIAIRSRCLANEIVDALHQFRRGLDDRGQRTERSLEACHHQRCANAFTGYISDRDAKPAVGQFEKIVVISAHLPGRPALPAVVQSRRRREPLREEML